MLDLTRIDLATEEDKANELDYWAELFKATTWEELRMLAEKDAEIEQLKAELAKLKQEK